jgi:hypothetical protein
VRLAKLLLLLAPLLLLGSAFYIGQLALSETPPEGGRPANIVGTQGLPFPGAKPPAPPPLILKDVSRETALEINIKVPFSSRPNPPAASFLFRGNEIDRQRAVTCLTAAAYYEAGNDLVGASAVVQVVLNRLRHPAFPKTICGVVFQGAERKTGCQFTFTCDGALRREPVAAIWGKLRGIAISALRGYVFGPVGYATHYHTNWVVPYWSGSLEKNAQVGTHLFFRWPDWYGSAKAFAGANQPGEMIDPRIERFVELADAPGDGQGLIASTSDLPLSPLASTPQVTAADLQGSRIRYADPQNSTFMVQLEPGAFPGSYATLALALCKGRVDCQVWGWTDSRLIPRDQRLTATARQQASFHFDRNVKNPAGIARWNCKEFARNRVDQCLAGVPPQLQVDLGILPGSVN